MKRSPAISAIFLGFIILLIDIDIKNVDIANDVFGFILFAYGLYSLKDHSHFFKKGYYFALLNTAWFAFSSTILYIAPHYSSFVFDAISYALYIPLAIYILSGLATLAGSLELPKLAKRLNDGIFTFTLYAILTLISFFLPEFSTILIIIAFFLYLHMLIQVNYAHRLTPDTSNSTKGKSLSKVMLLSIVLSVTLPIATGLGYITLSDSLTVDTEIFKKDLADSSLIAAVESKMVDLGFPQDVVDYMPGTEILKYEEIKDLQININEVEHDFSKLIVAQYISSLESGKYRFMVYYEWTENPQQSHFEVLGLELDKDMTALEDMNYSSLNLFDIEEDGRVRTYTSSDVKEEHFGKYAAKQFKLVNLKKADNYRGYIAFDALPKNKETMAHNNTFYYVQQKSIVSNSQNELLELCRNEQSGITIISDSLDKYVFMGYFDTRE
ncbi:MAG TPA: hypothetical protein VFD33_06580 [Bacillota bacterium]|nr:hypothetical protein [Bacillota bacterium]